MFQEPHIIITLNYQLIRTGRFRRIGFYVSLFYNIFWPGATDARYSIGEVRVLGPGSM